MHRRMVLKGGDYMGVKGGRSLRGLEESGYIPHNITLPPSIENRVVKYCQEEERPLSWCIQKALDEWLKKKGY